MSDAKRYVVQGIGGGLLRSISFHRRSFLPVIARHGEASSLDDAELLGEHQGSSAAHDDRCSLRADPELGTLGQFGQNTLV